VLLSSATEQCRHLHAPLFLARTEVDRARLAAVRGDMRGAAELARTALTRAAAFDAKGIPASANEVIEAS
jgi:hypothetical protein